MTYVQEIALTLMERGPMRQEALLAICECPRRVVQDALRDLQASRVARRARGWWVLAGYQGPVVVEPHSGRVRHRPARRQVTPLPSALPPRKEPPRVETRVVDGVEFEVVWSGRGSLVGDVDGMGSPLSALES